SSARARAEARSPAISRRRGSRSCCRVRAYMPSSGAGSRSRAPDRAAHRLMSLGVTARLQDRGAEPELLASHDVLCVRAPNPGPLTLSGTNTWLVGRDPTWVVDPGPADDAHVEHVLEAIAARGGLGGVALTHSHSDHRGAVGALLARPPA